MGNRRFRAAIKRPERKDLTWSERSGFALAGVFIIAYGYGQILRGRAIYTNWRGLDISAQFVIFLGALSLLVAIFPWARIHFLWNIEKKNHRR
ncbi:MAG TPA: hypothetical protein VLA42_07240 [Verrucomicrobiae bacterium]|jgi:hypothetical protein|nr:hypothetical protein [Verrucomicrobiae bacterium]